MAGRRGDIPGALLSGLLVKFWVKDALRHRSSPPHRPGTHCRHHSNCVHFHSTNVSVTTKELAGLRGSNVVVTLGQNGAPIAAATDTGVMVAFPDFTSKWNP